MANITYYYGTEALAEWRAEDDTAGANYGTAVTPTEGFGWLKSATVTHNVNLVSEYNISSAKFRKRDTAYKERAETTGTLTFWLPNDLGATTLDAWIVKLPFDAYNVTHDGSKWVIPNTAASVYGSNELLGFTLEIGHNKSGAVRAHILAGCVVDRFTCRARSGAPVEFTMDFIAKTATFNNNAFSNGSATRSTAEPLSWANCTCYYEDDGSQQIRTEITEFEFSIANNLDPRYDLTNSSTLEFNRMICGKQDISGNFTIDMSTTAGLDFYDALCDDGSAPYANVATVDNKECEIRIGDTTSPTTESVDFRFRKMHLTDIPMDIDPAAIQTLRIPWTAQYYEVIINSADSTAPSGWDISS